jgi:hypothetical protein
MMRALGCGIMVGSGIAWKVSDCCAIAAGILAAAARTSAAAVPARMVNRALYIAANLQSCRTSGASAPERQ